MEIAIGAKVFCMDGECGTLLSVIIDPVRKEITHLVVREKGFMGIDRLTPLKEILESTAEEVKLKITLEQFAKLEDFVDVHYLEDDNNLLGYASDEYYLHPYSEVDLSEPLPETIEMKRIPPDELAFFRGTVVFATDGKVGQVDEFLVSPPDHHISHLVMREGHFWGEKDVTIPVSQIERIDNDAVYLKLDKHAIGKLPAIPVRRHHT